MTAVAPLPDHEPVEVTPEMIWAALEEWSGFDEARDELGAFVAHIYRTMEAVRRDPRARPQAAWLAVVSVNRA